MNKKGYELKYFITIIAAVAIFLILLLLFKDTFFKQIWALTDKMRFSL